MGSKTSPLIPMQMHDDDGIFYDDDEIEFRYEQFSKRKQSSISFQKRTFICYSTIAFIVAVILGIVIGKITTKPTDILDTPIPTINKNINVDYSETIRNSIWNEIKSQNIRENLKKLTEKPHVAGSIQDEEHLVDFIKERWEGYLDGVEVFPYDVLLSFPNSSDLNYVGILYPNGSVTKKSNPIEKPVTEAEKNPNVIPGFNGYSPAGHVIGDLFYVNYAKIEDFEALSKLGINTTGGICIARYGKIFRGNKANNAAQYKCAGLVIYSDPMDYAGVEKHGWNPDSNIKTYPDNWWLPPTGLQRGSLRMKDGDPLTPGYPALNMTYRIPKSEAALPQIPVQPISYADAFNYISILGGHDAPDDWQGGFNVSYKFGGSFIKSHESCKAELHVSNYEKSKTIHTLIGFIRGTIEPDRYVMFGNHRDAWTFGGADPSSGTAVVLEVSRAIASVVKSGKWKPRRTIIFCNWASEEYGLIGSTEWVEQMEKRLLLRAVSYLNIDIAVEGGSSFKASSTPALNKLLYDVTKSVPNPNSSEIALGRSSVYDTWLYKFADLDNPNQPFVRNLGSGSDYTMLVQETGVASIDIRYTSDKHLSSYPTYHSLHDTFEYFDKFLDPGFNISKAIASIAADSLLQLSSSIALPMHPIDYANKLEYISGILETTHGDELSKHGITLNELYRTINVFNESAKYLTKARNELNETSSDLEIRRVNDKLFSINRGFLDFNGIPGRKYFRHVIFAPASHNGYGGSGFPGVSDAIFNAERGGSWEKVKQELSIVCLQILSASQLMTEF